MVKIKQELEAYFQDNWTDTPIQFDISTFQQPVDMEWISLIFIPIDRTIYAYDGANGRKADVAQFKVLSYSTSPTKALIIEESVKAFLECYELTTVDAQVEEGKPDTLGAINLGTGTYETGLLFSVTAWG